MIYLPNDLPDDAVLLKLMLGQVLSERESDKGKIVHLEKENALLRKRLFGRWSEQTAVITPPKMDFFSEAESVAESVDETAEKEVLAPTRRRGKRNPLRADLPRIEVIHELADHELTCACGCRKHCIGEEISEQLEILPMRTRAIIHVRKIYGCRDCQSAPITADKPAQPIEKEHVQIQRFDDVLTTNYVDGLPLHRIDKVHDRHGIVFPRETLVRARLLQSRGIHCEDKRVQVMKELDHEPTSQSWMWVQSGEPPNQPVSLFDNSTNRAQYVPSRLLEGYCGPPPQMAFFSEAESVAESVDETAEDEVVAPPKRWGKLKPLPADLPRIEVIHELADHELTCVCGCRKHCMGEEISEQLQILPMQTRAIIHVRKIYGCRDCQTSPITADRLVQLIEKSMAIPSALAMF